MLLDAIKIDEQITNEPDDDDEEEEEEEEAGRVPGEKSNIGINKHLYNTI